MSSFGGWLFSLLTGGLPEKLINAWQAAETRKYATLNDEAKRQHDAMMQARADAKEVRLATANFWEMRLLTFAIAAPFVVHLWLVTWDTNWPQPWSVASSPAPFDEWEGAILLSFFGIAGGVASVKAVAGAIAVKKKTR